MGIIKQGIKIVIWLARTIYLGLAIVIIFLAAYYFGKSLLFELKGGDTAAALSLVYWFDHWFPKIPLWFPSQGGGVSYVYGYQFMAHLWVVLLQRLSSLTLEQAYQLLGFLSVPLTSLGIYFFVWTRLKNQTSALISAFFYFLSPISWVWLFYWGFFGESISYIFIPPALIFFDLFLSSVLEGKLDFKTRLWFLLAVIALALLWFTHSIAFLGMLFFFPFYALLYPLLSAKRARIKTTLLSVLTVFIFLGATYLLAAFQMVHFQYYGLQTKTAGSASKEFFLKDAKEWYLKPFLSLGDIPVENRRYAERNVAFAVPVWSLAILGFASSFWLSKKLFVVGLYSALSFLFIFYPDPIWKILNLTGAQHYRPLVVPLRIFLPILAAFGIAAIPYFFWRLVFLWRKLAKKLSLLILPFEELLVAISTLALGVVAVIFFRYYATPPPTVRYGPETLDFELVDDSGWPYLCPSQEKAFAPSLCRQAIKPKINSKVLAENCFAWRLQGKPIFDFCQEEASQEALAKLVVSCATGQIEKERQGFCQALVEPLSKTLNVSSWPRPTVVGGNASGFIPDIYKDFLALKREGEFLRIDISPNLGPVTQIFPLGDFTSSTLSLHGYQSSLNHSYWGYQQNIFYAKHKPTSIYNAAKWFGVEFVLVNQDADPVENFQQDPDNWEMVAPGIFRFKQGTGLYSFSTTKPTYLVIGNEEKAAYETVFRTANEGVLSYDGGFLVQGKENIDDYFASQLRQFDAIILFGYSYRNPRKAFRLLDEYVKDGGNLFISTGWQYVDKDWEIEKAPDFFPVKELVWSTAHNKNSRYLLEDGQMGEVNVSEFSPLIWQDQAWGISLPATGIRDWAKTILSVDGKPLVVAGNFGRGKIIWTGLNWMGHIASFGFNQEEIKFLNQLLKSFFSGNPKDTNEKEGVIMKRDFPDKVEFTFANDSKAGATFYFRESYHPDWKAYLVSSGRKRRLPIYKAGPLYKLVKLPSLSSGDRLIFEYNNGARGILATLISLLTFILLILYLVLGKKITNQFTDLVRIGKGSISERVRFALKEEE